MKKSFKIVILLLLLCQSNAFAKEGTKAGKIKASVNIRGALGTYGNPPRLENGRVDLHRLISELKDIHANVYTSFVTNYGHLLDGIWFPYRAESVGSNLQDATQVKNEIAKLRQMFNNPDFPIFLAIYATAHSRLGASTPEYLKDVISAGRKSADGVLIYCHQDPVKSPAKYLIIKEGFK